MARVYIGVGSNIDPEGNVPRALDALLRLGVEVAASSRFYRTEPIGRPGQPAYANGVWQALTDLSPRELKEVLRETEARVGRVRSSDKFAAREIDLDILLFDDLQLAAEDIRIPDPHLMERPFLARCVAELDPQLRLPGSGLPILDQSRDSEHLEEYVEITATIRRILEKGK